MNHSSPPCLRTALLVALVAISPEPMKAQAASRSLFPPISSIGLHGGIPWSTHSNVLALRIGDEERAPVTANGFGASIGLNASFRLASTMFLRYVADFGSWRASSLDRATVLAVLRDAGDSTPRPVGVSYGAEIRYDVVTISALFSFDALGGAGTRLAVEFGPAAGLALDGNLLSTVSLDQSEPGRFDNPLGYPTMENERTLVLYDDRIPEVEHVRMGVIGGLRLIQRIAPSIDLSTALHVDLSLVDVTKRAWRASAVTFDVGIEYVLDE